MREVIRSRIEGIDVKFACIDPGGYKKVIRRTKQWIIHL